MNSGNAEPCGRPGEDWLQSRVNQHYFSFLVLNTVRPQNPNSSKVEKSRTPGEGALASNNGQNRATDEVGVGGLCATPILQLPPMKGRRLADRLPNSSCPACEERQGLGCEVGPSDDTGLIFVQDRLRRVL